MNNDDDLHNFHCFFFEKTERRKQIKWIWNKLNMMYHKLCALGSRLAEEKGHDEANGYVKGSCYPSTEIGVRPN